MPDNWYMILVAALIPTLVGAVWYHPKVLGTAWMKTNKFEADDLQGTNMAVIFGVSLLLSAMLAVTIMGVAIHQGAIYQSMLPRGGAEWSEQAMNDFKMMMERYGNNYRTFGHGALHGFVFSLFAVLPLIGIIALFERRGWKYISIHVGYWMISLVLMGGLLCKTLHWSMPF